MRRVMLLCFLFTSMNTCRGSFPDDIELYRSGQKEYEILQTLTKSPKYGQCWIRTHSLIKEGCKHLTDAVQMRLAFAYLNCFLELQGITPYPCHEGMDMEHCLRGISEADRGLLGEFFTHTLSICYFLEFQFWHETIQESIRELNHLSEKALKNQKIMMERALNLSHIITSSMGKLTADLHDIFGKITHVHKTMTNFFAWYNSVGYYTFFIIFSYLTTSIQQTSAARLWTFLVIALNIVIERIFFSNDYIEDYNSDRTVSNWTVYCRYFFFSTAVFLVVFYFHQYQDPNREILNYIRNRDRER